MTKEEFVNLKRGDICIITKGLDSNKRCIVKYVGDDCALLLSEDRTPFIDEDYRGNNLKLKLVSRLDFSKIEES